MIYRKIDTRIWNDEKFRGLSPEAKQIFTYLLTHPSMTALGAMRGSKMGVLTEMVTLGVTLPVTLGGTIPERYPIGWGELCRKGMIEVDETACYIAAPNFCKYNSPDNPNVLKSWANSLDFIPECELLGKQLQRLKNLCEARGNGFIESYEKNIGNVTRNVGGNVTPYVGGNHGGNREQEQEQEQEHKEDKSPLPPLPKKPKVEIVFPTELDTPAFRESWGNWERHRKEIRHPLKPTTIQSQLAMLAEMGEPNAVLSIKQSIQNGYQGLFEVKGNANGNARKHTQRDGEYPENLKLTVWDATKTG